MSSAFKFIYKNMLESGRVPDKLKKPIKCYVKETSPYFLVTDDWFYVPCYFTKKAVDGFKSGAKGLADMQGKVITISDWTLEMAKVKSDQVFTSYAGIEIRFVVNSVSVAASSSDSIELTRQPSNIYRDSEIKNMINRFVWEKTVGTVSAAGLPDISKMSGKGNVGASIVKSGDVKFGFKSTTSCVSVSSAKKSSSGKAQAPTVKGGAKKVIKKTSKGGSVAAKLMKSSVGKKSTVGGKHTIGKGDSGANTTNVKSMNQFKKLVAKHKKAKK